MQQHGNGVVVVTGDGQIQSAITVEVSGGYANSEVTCGELQWTLECAITIAQ
jgi:hypothetical protein